MKKRQQKGTKGWNSRNVRPPRGVSSSNDIGEEAVNTQPPVLEKDIQAGSHKGDPNAHHPQTDRTQAELQTTIDDLQRRIRELELRIDERTAEPQHSLREFSLLADNVPALFAYLDVDQCYQYVNRHCASLYNRDVQEMIGRTLREIQGPKLYESVRPHILEALSGKTTQFELVIETADGARVFQATYMPDLDPQGQVVGVYMLADDITRRKRIEQALDEEKQRLAAIVNMAADAIITVDRQGVIRDFNRAAERMFGYASEEAVGMGIHRLITPGNGEPGPFPHQYFRKQESERDAIHHEAIGNHKQGSRFPLEMAVSEIDHLDLYVTLLRDLSERKALEQEVIEMSAIEQERIGREIHDGIGQQLTALGMLANNLAKRLGRTALSQEAETAGQLVTYLQQALYEVKALSKGLSPVEIGPEGLADSLAKLVERAGISAGIQCDFVLSGVIPDLDEMVAVHLYRIVQEAINNAIKHADASRIEVKVRLPAQHLAISVADNGIGIDPMKNRKGRLGLHIMRYRSGIIGATLKIQAIEAGGTLVSCSLPLAS